MKKIISLILAAVLCVMITGCAQKSQNVKNTEVMIKAIGEVTDQSGEDIATAEKFYNNLTSEEKGQVSNYDTLLQAREKYNGLIHYGQWIQLGKDDAMTFTLSEDGSFVTSQGSTGSFEITDNFVVLKFTNDGETITFEKETDKNLLHLKTENADYIRPDLLTTDKKVILSSNWYRFFDVNYHVHIEKDGLGLATDYWNCYTLVPKEEYADIIAPQTDVTFTFNYTVRDVATVHNMDDDSLIIAEEITEPVRQTATVHLTTEAFTHGGCCNADYDIVRAMSGPYKEFKYVYKTLEYLENAEITSFDGLLYYYDQLTEESTFWEN